MSKIFKTEQNEYGEFDAYYHEKGSWCYITTEMTRREALDVLEKHHKERLELYKRVEEQARIDHENLKRTWPKKEYIQVQYGKVRPSKK